MGKLHKNCDGETGNIKKKHVLTTEKLHNISISNLQPQNHYWTN